MMKFINTVMKIKATFINSTDNEDFSIYILHEGKFIALISCHHYFSKVNSYICLPPAGKSDIVNFDTEEQLLRFLLNTKLSKDLVDSFSSQTSYSFEIRNTDFTYEPFFLEDSKHA